MIKRILAQVLFGLLVAGTIDAAVGRYETFHDNQGRELQARLLSVDPQSNKVKVQLRNGKTRTTDLSVFSEDDQTRILEWHITEVVFSDKNFKVTINKKSQGSDRRRGEVDGWTPKNSGMRVQEIAYELELENRNKTPMKGLKAEYCIYHQSKEKGLWVEYEYDRPPSREYDKGYEDNAVNNSQRITNKRRTVGAEKIPDKTIPGITTGIVLIPELPSKESSEGLTKEVPLKKGSEFRPLAEKEEGYPKRRFPEIDKNPTRRIHEERKVAEEVVGVVFRISIPLASGGYARKEYSYPKDLLEKKTVDWDALNEESSEEEDEGAL